MLPGGMTEEDLAAILRATPPGGAAAPRRVPFGFGPMTGDEAVDPARAASAVPSFGAGSNMPEAPQAPVSPPGPAPLALRVSPRPGSVEPPEAGGPVLPDFKPADLPPGASPAVPMGFRPPAPPPRPSDMPSADAVPTAATAPAPVASGAAPAAPAAPAVSEPSFLDKLMGGIRKTDGLLGSLGIGLLSAPTMHEGLAAGLKNHQVVGAQKAVSDIARTKAIAEQQKAARETRNLTANATFVKSAFEKQGRPISDDQAMSFGSNQTVMNDLIKGVLPPQEVYRQETDANGNSYNVNTHTGQKTVLLQAKPDETVAMVPSDERVKLGLPDGSYQRDAKGKISPVNPTGTTINMGAEKAQDAEIGKAYGKQYVDLQASGRNAGAKMNTLALMEQAMNSPDFYSGVGGEGVKRANQFLGALGVRDVKAASGAEVFSALSNKVVLDQLGGTLGAGVSNTDRDYITTIGPGLEKTPEGNKQLIGMYRSVAQREQQISKMAREYATKNGGRIDAGFDDLVDDYAKKNPLFPAAQASATAKSDGVTGPTAAGGIASPRSQSDFDALPKGATYIDPSDGRRYRKN